MRGGFSIFALLLLYQCEGNRLQSDDVIDSCELSPILVPDLYDLKFDLNFPEKNFTGEVVIKGRVVNETRTILLDSGVSVENVSLHNDQNEIDVISYSEAPGRTLVIEFKYPLLPEIDYKLKINFFGEIRKLRGIYGGNYKSPTGDESYFVATEFQPNFASYAFPCLDRPGYKAHFVLNISRESHHVALSNMPLSSSRPDFFDDNKVWDSFDKTPVMSTYTFAFVVGDLVPCPLDDYYDPHNNLVWVTRGNERLASLSSKWAPIYTKNLELYTNVSYDLPKLDHVALPYLASTAMENWGLITYKQEVLLIDEITHTVKSEFGLIWIMAHEITHQWFGNLVTCSSWAYTWLNEGITSFLHFLISGKVFPEWDMHGLMITEEVLKVMDDEGFSQVSLTKENCSMESSDTFSMASYYKGAAIMRMVYYMIGEEEMRKGLQSYIKANKYGHVTQEDLWVHFEDNTRRKHILPEGVSLGDVMETWSNNVGFPVVTMKRLENSVRLDQARMVFFLPDELPEQKWWIPLSYTTSSEKNFSNTVPRSWMDPHSEYTFINVSLKNSDWIIFNIQQSGYYRFLYDPITWASLSEQLLEDIESIPPLNRAKLIDDAFTLAFYKQIKYNIPLTLLRYMAKETHYYPWSAAIRAIDQIHFYLKMSDVNEKFEEYMLKLVEKVFNTLSYYNDYNNSYRDTNSRLLYVKILQFACNLRHKGCEERAKQMMSHLLDSDLKFTSQHVDEINPLLCTMVRLGGQEIWDLAFEMYKKEKIFKPKDELMDALTCTVDKNVWKRLTRNYLEGHEEYLEFDFFTSHIYDKKSYCYIIEVLEELLEKNNDSSSNLTSVIQDLSGHFMPETCRQMLIKVTEKYIEDKEEMEDILASIEKTTLSWSRIKEIEEWFAEELNKIESSDSSDSSDNNLIERSIYDGMDDMVDLPSYPYYRPNDYDETEKRNNTNSSASLKFNLLLIIFSILPSPMYLTYLIFAPFI